MQELLYQALETEQGGQKIYQAAIECATNPELKAEWQKYLEETTQHEQILLTAFERLSLDPSVETPGRLVVRFKGEALVTAMRQALATDKAAAQLVAAECVVEAETKDHQNWELIGKLSEAAKGNVAAALKEAFEQVEDQEDEHLYHTMGWSRELWMDSLGLPAVLPPPEEQRKVKTAIGAARAEQERESMLSGSKRN
jgi:demethoxyubiquinone hydroxylase (CLK1/Coq7/Cat5 family)